MAKKEVPTVKKTLGGRYGDSPIKMPVPNKSNG